MSTNRNFADGMKAVIRNLDQILTVADVFTPEVADAMEKIRKIDWDNAALMTSAYNSMQKGMPEVKTVLTGMPEIKNLVEIQNQVHRVSDAKDTVEIVAGSIEDIKAANSLAPTMIKCNGLEPTLNEILDMKSDIQDVIKNKDKIEDINQTATDMQGALQKMEDMYLAIKAELNQLHQAKIEILSASEKIEINLNESRAIEKRQKEFKVKSFSIEPDRKGYSKYEPSENTLNLFIQKGEKGEKGKTGESGRRGQRGIPGTAANQGATGETGRAGRDGNDFSVTMFGMKRERAMYGNRAVGTSFVSLDETPVMIYFRKSNTLDDWTDGQPFGLSHGDFSVSEIAGAVLQLIKEKGN